MAATRRFREEMTMKVKLMTTVALAILGLAMAGAAARAADK